MYKRQILNNSSKYIIIGQKRFYILKNPLESKIPVNVSHWTLTREYNETLKSVSYTHLLPPKAFSSEKFEAYDTTNGFVRKRLYKTCIHRIKSNT